MTKQTRFKKCKKMGCGHLSTVPYSDGKRMCLLLCQEQDEKLYAVIERLVRSQEPILVWGGGTLTRRLLATSRLAEANIVGFVDSNPNIQGHRLAGRDIFSPTQIAGRNETIMVCSKAFEREIVRMIRDELRLPNQVILLG